MYLRFFQITTTTTESKHQLQSQETATRSLRKMLRRVSILSSSIPKTLQQQPQQFATLARYFSTSEVTLNQQKGWWEHLEPVGLDAIKQLTIAFQQDPATNKVLLGEGVYRDHEGKPVVLKSVREVFIYLFTCFSLSLSLSLVTSTHCPHIMDPMIV